MAVNRKSARRSGFFLAAVLASLAPFTLLAACRSTSLADIRAAMPDMAATPDGVYRGEYDLKGAPTKVVLDVAVKDRAIAGITIVKHIRSPIGKKAEKIIDEIIEKQSLDIDAVSGATGSSKSILKAVENALR